MNNKLEGNIEELFFPQKEHYFVVCDSQNNIVGKIPKYKMEEWIKKVIQENIQNIPRGYEG